MLLTGCLTLTLTNSCKENYVTCVVRSLIYVGTSTSRTNNFGDTMVQVDEKQNIYSNARRKNSLESLHQKKVLFRIGPVNPDSTISKIVLKIWWNISSNLLKHFVRVKCHKTSTFSSIDKLISTYFLFCLFLDEKKRAADKNSACG